MSRRKRSKSESPAITANANGNGATHDVKDILHRRHLERELVDNIVMSRQELMTKLLDNRRDINKECGYKETILLTPDVYKIMYEREAIAARVVQVLPIETWQTQPTVYEDEDSENITAFEQCWDELGNNLRGSDNSWYQDEEGSPIWEALQRADILSGIGSFGVLLLGINDEKPVHLPIEGFEDGRWSEIYAGSGTEQQYSDWMRNPSQVVTGKAFKKKKQLDNPSSVTQNYAVPNKTKPKPEEVDQNDLEGEQPAPTEGDQPQEETGQDPSAQGENPQAFGGQGEEGLVDEAGNPVDTTDEEQPQFDEDGNPVDQSGLDGEVGADVAGDPTLGPVEINTKYKLLYLRAFDESMVQIDTFETDPYSPRYGQPVFYHITLVDPNDTKGGIGITNAVLRVHWSRIIHIADNLGSSEIYGAPRMRAVWNRLYDLVKLYAGSAEMYWRGAFPGLAFETHPQLGADVKIDATQMRDQMEKYMNSLQRYITAEGMTVKSISPTVSDPSTQIETQITAICIDLSIPMRIFMGSERGELASGQDDSTWNDRLRARQRSYVTPRIIVPFVDRLIKIGVLPEPIGYSVSWPDVDSGSETEQSQVAVARTNALTSYVGGGLDTLIAPLDFLTRIMGFTEEDADAMLESVIQHQAMANPDMDPNEIVPGQDPNPPPTMVPGPDGQMIPVDENTGEQMTDENGDPIEGPAPGDVPPGEEDPNAPIGGKKPNPFQKKKGGVPPQFVKNSDGSYYQSPVLEWIYNNLDVVEELVINEPHSVEGQLRDEGGKWDGYGAGTSARSLRRYRAKARADAKKAGLPDPFPKAKRNQGMGGKFSGGKVTSAVGFKQRYHGVLSRSLNRPIDEAVDAAVGKILHGKPLLPEKGKRIEKAKEKLKQHGKATVEGLAGATKGAAKEWIEGSVATAVGLAATALAGKYLGMKGSQTAKSASIFAKGAFKAVNKGAASFASKMGGKLSGIFSSKIPPVTKLLGHDPSVKTKVIKGWTGSNTGAKVRSIPTKDVDRAINPESIDASLARGKKSQYKIDKFYKKYPDLKNNIRQQLLINALAQDMYVYAVSNLEDDLVDNHIVKLKSGKYRLLSHEGKNLGTFDSHEAAAKHEGEVEYFKHANNQDYDPSVAGIGSLLEG